MASREIRRDTLNAGEDKLRVGYFKLRVGYFAWLNQSDHSFKLRIV